MLPQYLVYISIPTTLFAIYFYVRDILLGTTKPNLASWFIWFLAPTIAALISFGNGAGLSALPVFMSGIGPLIVILVSIKNKNAYWKLSTLDYVCLALSLLAIFIWIFLEEGTLATVLAISADFIAFFPTYFKSWHFPDTETLTPYFSGSFNSFISLLTLSVVSFSTFGFPLYLLFGNLVEIVIVFFRRRNQTYG